MIFSFIFFYTPRCNKCTRVVEHIYLFIILLICAVAAGILKGKHIAPYTRLIIVPASGEVLSECIRKGYIQDLMAAGATIAAPGCAACLGVHEGILAPGEICITSTNRNFPGRMGSKEASLYLASPATVAASLLNGRITDPRPYL